MLGVSFLVYWMALELGRTVDADYYYEYTEFYDPTIVMQDMGVVAMAQRDVGFEMEQAAEAVLIALGWRGHELDEEEFLADGRTDADESGDIHDWGGSMTSESSLAIDSETREETGAGDEPADEGHAGEYAEEMATEQPEYNMLELDLVKLAELSSGSSEKEWLSRYIAGLEPTKTNEYTGMFKDCNLIYITAEGFSTYAVNADLTPTLYKLANSGFVFTNYYVPLWQTSTSDGEYVNLTGLIPDGQFSMKKSAENNMAYALPAFFQEEGCVNMAYHNNTLSYYDRHLSHPNLGYDFKASKLGDLEEAEWGDKIFYMENPGRWPSSDLEMFQYTIPEYIQAQRFNVYYMTVSGHMYYSFTGNSMSKKNQEAVAHLDMSENARAYIA